MCTPVAAGVLLGVTSMASTALNIKAQQQQLGQEAQVTAANAVAQTKVTVAALDTRRKQEATRITLDQIRRYSQGRRERSTMVSRSSDSVGGGATVLRDTVTSVIQEEMDVDTHEVSKEWTDNQLLQEQLGAIAGGQSEINRAQAMLKARPGGMSSVLQVIGAGVSGYSQGNMLGQGMSTGRKL